MSSESRRGRNGLSVAGEAGTRAVGMYERRRQDRRSLRGRRRADHSYPCFSAPFVAHCLAQFWDEDGISAVPAPRAALAYARMKRRLD